MFAEHVTEDGFKLQVFTSLYMDWGLAIYNPDGDLVAENAQVWEAVPRTI